MAETEGSEVSKLTFILTAILMLIVGGIAGFLMLIDAVPSLDDSEPSTRTVRGEVPSPLHPPSGCRFRTRCLRAEDRCAAEEPALRQVGEDHFVACHYPLTAETRAPLTKRRIA